MGGESFHKTKDGAETSVVFALTEGVGALAEALKVFKVRKIFEKIYQSNMNFNFFVVCFLTHIPKNAFYNIILLHRIIK